jgi:hypothetical protein
MPGDSGRPVAWRQSHPTWLTIVGCRRAHRCGLRVPGFQRVNLRTKPGRRVAWFPHVRTVKTASGTPAVQIARFSHQGSWDTGTSRRRMMTLSWSS